LSLQQMHNDIMGVIYAEHLTLAQPVM
jgi:hypothetical protein